MRRGQGPPSRPENLGKVLCCYLRAVGDRLKSKMKLIPYKTKGLEMGLTHISVTLKNFTTNDSYKSNFLVDTGAINSLAPASELIKIGITPVGKRAYEMADGSLQEYEFGLAEISFMNEITAGCVIFGPEGVEPLLGVTAMESAGVSVDPQTQSLKRLPSIYLK